MARIRELKETARERAIRLRGQRGGKKTERERIKERLAKGAKRAAQERARTGRKLPTTPPKKVQRGKFPTKPGTAAVRVKPRTPEEALTRAGKRRVEKAEEKAKARKKRRK